MRKLEHFFSLKAWSTIIFLNILLLLESLKCIIKVWNRPRAAASLALWTHSHSWTITTLYCLPMVMVGMSKSLMFSVFTIQFKRRRSQIDHKLCNPKMAQHTSIFCLPLITIKPCSQSRNDFTIQPANNDTKHAPFYSIMRVQITFKWKSMENRDCV